MNDMSRAAVRVACDVGGTFTDVCVLDQATGQMRVAKTPTTPDPIDGVLNGIKAGGVDLRDMVLFAHGTTLATNALITRNFPPAIMVTTKGFRDVIEIRRGTRDDLWDTYKEMAPPYIQRRNRLVVTERIDYSGAVIEPVNEAEAREAARIINKRGVKTIAVCFANAFANPENERRMRDILEEEVPGTSISLSSEIMPEIFEHERFSTTVANAVLAPGRRRLRDASRQPPPRRRLRRGHPVAALRRRRDDREDGGQVRGPARRLRHRRGRHREPLRRPTRGLRELHQPRHGRHQHRCLALRPGQSAGDHRLVRAVRLSDLLPQHRGADHRRRRRLARLDRRRRIRSATGRSRQALRRGRPATAGAAWSPPTPTPTSSLAASATGSRAAPSR